jgi:hypothetical protein
LGRKLTFRILIFAAVIGLLAALAMLSQPYRHSAAWREAVRQEPIVDQALVRGAWNFGVSPQEYKLHTRPRIERSGHQICIHLDTHRSDGGGSYVGCFDSRSGALISETAEGLPLGSEGLWNRFGHWIW